MSQPLMYVEFGAVDVPRAAQFFKDVFDWHFTDISATGYSTFSSGPGGIGGGIQRVSMVQPGGGIILYVSVADIDAFCERILSHGGKVIRPKEEIPGVGWYAHFADLDSNLFGLFTQHPENPKQY